MSVMVLVWVFLRRLLEVYRTGRGGLVVRGKADVEKMDKSGSRSAVIISEVITFDLFCVRKHRTLFFWLFCARLVTDIN